MNKQDILVTGSAGFIGFHVAKRLLADGHRVVGLDNFNNYYDPQIKEARNAILKKHEAFKLYRGDLADNSQVSKIFELESVDKVCHLAAQAGVRYSLENPYVYENSNMLGTLNILESMRRHGVNDLVFASSSSVYGGIQEIPFHEDMRINQPVSLYAATKAANELYAHAYHHLYGLNTVGLRFFTVYGPWGRPDMALFLFVDAILNKRPIQVFNHGDMVRDFTYIDDIVGGVVASLEAVEQLGYEIINLGCSSPVNLLEFIQVIEETLDQEAEKEMLPMQPGDVRATYADVSKAHELLDYTPRTTIKDGVRQFVEWYKKYYAVA